MIADDQALANAISIVEMEGHKLSEADRALISQYSSGKISWDEFLVKALGTLDEE